MNLNLPIASAGWLSARRTRCKGVKGFLSMTFAILFFSRIRLFSSEYNSAFVCLLEASTISRTVSRTISRTSARVAGS